MLNDSWAGRNQTKGCSADWRRRRMNIEGNFAGYLYIMDMTNARKMKHIDVI
jgi:hypothetical protein